MIDNTELTAGGLRSCLLKPRKVIRVCGMLAQYCVRGTISKPGNVVVMAAWIFLLFPCVPYLDYTKLYWSTGKFYKLAYTWKQKMQAPMVAPKNQMRAQNCLFLKGQRRKRSREHLRQSYTGALALAFVVQKVNGPFWNM